MEAAIAEMKNEFIEGQTREKRCFMDLKDVARDGSM